VLNTLAGSFASIFELFTSYSHTSRMTVVTTDHICNCSTSNSNSEHPRRTTRFTRISEIQLTRIQKPYHSTNYRLLITDHLLMDYKYDLCLMVVIRLHHGLLHKRSVCTCTDKLWYTPQTMYTLTASVHRDASVTNDYRISLLPICAHTE